MITPTNGRIVWFHPAHGDAEIAYLGSPLAAVVAHVWTERMVNLTVFDANGVPCQRTNVQLVQDGDQEPDVRTAYCEWMPFQKGQAAKTEALEKKAAAA